MYWCFGETFQLLSLGVGLSMFLSVRYLYWTYYVRSVDLLGLGVSLLIVPQNNDRARLVGLGKGLQELTR